MNCPNCGANVEANDLFCTSCGTRMTQPEPQPAAESVSAQPVSQTYAAPAVNNEQPKDNSALLKNLVKFGTIAVVAVVLLVVLIKIFTSGTDYIFREKNLLPIEVDDEIRFVIDDKMGEAKQSGSLDEYETSTKGDITVFTTVEETEVEDNSSSETDDEYYDDWDDWGEPEVERTYTLFWTDGDKVTKIADDCGSFFVLSADGTGVVYYDADGNICLYNIEKDENVKVYDYSENKNFSGITIAPNGDTVVFKVIEYTEEDETKSNIYLFDGKENAKVTSDGFVIAMSDDGDLIYVVTENDEGEEKLNVYKGTSGDKVSLGKYSDVVCFNNDNTQIMFTDGEKTYISDDGKESVKISSKSGFDIVVPEGCVGVEDLYGKVYEADNGLYLIEEDEEPIKLASRVYQVTMDASGEYIYFIKSGDETLLRIEIADEDKAADNAVKIAEDVDGYIITSDCKNVYYSSDDTLYSVDGRDGDDKTSIAEDVTMAQIDGNDVFYYICDEELFTCVKGEKYGKLKSDIMGITKEGDYVYAFTKEDISVCLGKKSIEKLTDHNMFD